MRYLHVRKEELVNIASPLDDFWKKGGIQWHIPEKKIKYGV